MRKRKIIDNIQGRDGMERYEGVVWLRGGTQVPRCSLWWAYKNASGHIRWMGRHRDDAKSLYKTKKPMPAYKRIPK